MTAAAPGRCPLCDGDGGIVLARSAKWRLIRADEPGFPGFYRLVWNAHVREFSDLQAADRADCMDIAVQVELAIRRHLQPAKVNLASLGNAVPHLHWHIVARFDWDSHFPGAVWSVPLRAATEDRIADIVARRGALDLELGKLACRVENRTGS